MSPPRPWALACACLCALACNESPAVPDSSDGNGTAGLDSVFGETEYANALCIAFHANQPDGTLTPGQACFMNDASNFYVGVVYEPGPTGTAATLAVHLDETGNGTIGDGTTVTGDDLWTFHPSPQLYQDQAWSSDPSICPPNLACHFLDTTRGGTHDGHGIYFRGATAELFELRHPLASGDGWDIRVASGDSIGVRLMLLIEDGIGHTGVTWLGDPALLQVEVK